MLCCVFVVGMHLDGQPLGREEDLYEQRTDAAARVPSQERFRIGGDRIAEGRAARDGILVDGKPRLADGGFRVFGREPGRERANAPRTLFEQRQQTQRLHGHIVLASQPSQAGRENLVQFTAFEGQGIAPHAVGSRGASDDGIRILRQILYADSPGTWRWLVSC